MNVLDKLRPRAEHLTDDRSRDLLTSVLATPQHRRRPRWSRVTAFGLCGVIVAGGTAYATGLVPGIVSDRFQQVTGGGDGWPDPVSGERQVADVLLSNGKHARVWYAETTDGLCVIRDMSGEVDRPEGFAVECTRWGYGAEKSDPRRGVHWQTSVDGPAVVYGDFEGVAADVARVDVAAPGWTRSFPVEEGAFAGEVPAGADGDRIRFVYRDAGGEPIAGRVDTVRIESE